MCNDPNVTERKSATLLDNWQNKGDRERSPVGTKEIKRIANNARFAAGGQCDQSDLVRSVVCNESFFLCSLRNFSEQTNKVRIFLIHVHALYFCVVSYELVMVFWLILYRSLCCPA